MKAFFVIAIIALVITGSGSWGGLMFYSLPVMAWAVLGIFALQGLGFIPAFLYQTERYYDLIGSLTYISAIALVLLCSGEVDLRQMLIAFFILIWAARLGSFLFSRIARDGGDSRFDKIKPSALLFFRTWMLQGLWVTVTAGAALAALSSGRSVPLNIVDGIAMALWLSGFAVEVIADRQKRQFRQAHGSDTFITTGLWSLSRHPNYFGEIILWTGIALLTFPVLDGGQYLTLVSPLFVYLLLVRISGIPLLENKANRRWGNDPAYITYRKNTPALVPRLRKPG
jgi:steroid 5-alpha reductase family enzyme